MLTEIRVLCYRPSCHNCYHLARSPLHLCPPRYCFSPGSRSSLGKRFAWQNHKHGSVLDFRLPLRIDEKSALWGYNAASSGNYRYFEATYRPHIQGSRILDVTDRLSRNVGKVLPILAAQLPRRAQFSGTNLCSQNFTPCKPTFWPNVVQCRNAGRPQRRTRLLHHSVKAWMDQVYSDVYVHNSYAITKRLVVWKRLHQDFCFVDCLVTLGYTAESVFFFLTQQPSVGLGLHIHEVCKSHTTRHSR